MRELQAGVYRLYDENSGKSFVGFSRNLAGIRKRLLFELKLNACPYTELQRAYAKYGGLSFEILENCEAEAGMTDEELDAHLSALMLRYRQIHNAKPIQ
ncbi:MAG TPA: hypothetical protein VN366_07235 [Feifaniaceae bacterium]|nr:hypothetical protein [Feifaniaceae bacterium]